MPHSFSLCVFSLVRWISVHILGNSCDVLWIKGFSVLFLLHVVDKYKRWDLFYSVRTEYYWETCCECADVFGKSWVESQPGSLTLSVDLDCVLWHVASLPLLLPADSLALHSGFMDSDNHTKKLKLFLELKIALVELCSQSEGRSTSARWYFWHDISPNNIVLSHECRFNCRPFHSLKPLVIHEHFSDEVLQKDLILNLCIK